MTLDVVGAYDGLLGGELEPALEARRILQQESGPGALAWRALFDAAIGFAAPELAPLPVEAEALAASVRGHAEAIPPGARAAVHALRRAVLAFDLPRASAAHRAVLSLSRGADPESVAWARVADAWMAILSGAPVDEALEAAIREGQAGRRPELVLEASALRALSTAERGDISGALAIARRASRMARTESLPQSEYLANVVLARIRRLDNKPHLATRILHALYSVAPSPWLPWLAWEIVQATGALPVLPPTTPGAAAPHALEALLGRAWAGDRPGFDRAARAAAEQAQQVAPLSADLSRCLQAIDPEISPAALEPALAAWALGTTPEPPLGVIGLAKDSGAPGEPVAWVWAPADRGGRRVLSPGVALARASSGAEEPVPSDAKQLRTDSAIAALALVGREGIAEEALFHRLYGFTYEPERHLSVRDVLYLRVRRRAQPATLEREGGKVWLAHQRPLLVPDPRSSPVAEIRILRVLAERRTAAPKEVAAELGISVRTAQDALSRLAEDGAVRKEKARLGLQYILEDTTFSEPTRNIRR